MIKSFTIYREYYDLITLLNEEEQKNILLGITKYMFEDVEPELNEREMKVFNNLKRPLEKSKQNSKRVTNQKPNENQMGNQIDNQMGNQLKTHQDVYVYVNDNVINNLEKVGYGEEKPLIASEGSSLLETTKEIISYLNEVTKSKFKYSSKATQSKINARLNEGYILDDFIAVIDKKWVEWKNTDFEKYMCPETLFGTKFEKYLNQKTKSKSKNDEQWELLKGMANGTITIN